jgi:glycosyltransferase involved in cell wall biosynthesis
MISVRFVTRKWPPAVGGMETYSWRMAEGLSNRTALDVIALPGRKCGRAPGTLSLLRFSISAATKLISSQPVDVVHVADIASWPLAWIAAVRHPRSRIVLSAHGSDVSFAMRPGWKCRMYRLYLRVGARMLARATVIANSHYVADLAATAGFKQVRVVPLATDLQRPCAGERKQLLYAGRISKAKGLRFVVEQVLPLLPLDLKLRVAGTVWEESERDVLRNERVVWLGSLTKDELAAEYASCLAALIPTRASEGFGLVAIEAAACGAHVIASNHSGLAEVVQPPLGTVVDADDPEAWVSAIRAVLRKTAKLRESESRAAREEVDRSYRWPRVIDATLSAYAE